MPQTLRLIIEWVLLSHIRKMRTGVFNGILGLMGKFDIGQIKTGL